jgi:N-acetylglucosaminyl-diphospho-decaprenol L-rhamnosyltransferase
MSSEPPPVTAVIVTYQSRAMIGRTLDGLREAHQAGLADCVVVDNASSDGTADHVAQAYPWVKLIRSERNLGFGRGCNLGFRHVASPYVLFLNPDAVIERQALCVLMEFMEAHPAAGIAGPATHVGDGLQKSGYLLTPWVLVKGALGMVEPYPQVREIAPGEPPRPTNWVCGGIMLVRSELFRRLGGFDPRFFLYFEETDLCVRARAAGYELWAIGEAIATHASNTSARKIDPTLAEEGCLSQHYYQSRYYYLTKHHGIVAATCAEVGELMLKAMRDFVRFLGGRGGADKFRRRLRGPVLMFPRALMNKSDVAP